MSSSREADLELLEVYSKTLEGSHDNHETKEQLEFLRQQQDLLHSKRALYRDHFPAHMTGSAFVINSNHELLLVFHKKLQKWLQPGGHCDGHSPQMTAQRELLEETGLSLIPQKLIDLDIHLIPQTLNEPEHYHFDMRFLFHCSTENKITLDTNEVEHHQWISLTQINRVTQEESILRVARKLSSFR